MRDGTKFACKAVFLCAGPKSGKISNEFHFVWQGPGTATLTDFGNLATDVAGFYNTMVVATGSNVATFLGNQFSRATNLSAVDVYDIDTANPRDYYGTPVATGTFTLAAAGTGTLSLPNEVAATVSFRADYGGDPEHGMGTRPRADDRGRVYIGPLLQNALAMVTLPTGQKLPTLEPSFMSTCLGALTTMANQSFVHKFRFSTWSRKTQAFKEVVSKAMNNDPDTQQRRSLATSLLSWVPL
jgi:hypothetical protein